MKKECTKERIGIAAGGNWIVDHIKTVDRLPERGMLASILSQSRSAGGAPANVLADLAQLRAPFPLEGYGVIGDDADGTYILDAFRRAGVRVDGLQRTDRQPTSYTDVMTERETGDRTFYHRRGANALFAPEHVPLDGLRCRIFHLGYILLLDQLDAPDPECGTVAARLLRDLRERGIRTSVDVVSEAGDRFGTLVPPALAHSDYAILNEIEAARAAGLSARDAAGRLDRTALQTAMRRLRQMGPMRLLAVHMPEGAVLLTDRGEWLAFGSLELPGGYIRSAVGAGDAFCAGLLYGLHEGWPLPECARLAQCTAATSLAAEGASEGVLPLEETLALAARYPARCPPL
jgi:sugar/nucleoside kinase (ribokinase family)